MKFLAGLVAGVCLVMVAGAAVERHIVVLEGDFGKVGVYQPAFSGVSAEGNCFLAMTDTRTGKTEVVCITKETQKKFSEKAFQMSQEGRVVVWP